MEVFVPYDTDDLFLEASLLWLHFAVPMIFDRVVGSSRQVLRNHRPFVPKGFDTQGQNPLFIERPFCLIDSFTEVVVPSLTALLSSTIHEFARDCRPIPSPVLIDQLP